jgi:hypothetical protein
LVGLNPPGGDAWLVTVNDLAGKPYSLELVTAMWPVTLRTPGGGRHGP